MLKCRAFQLIRFNAVFPVLIFIALSITSCALTREPRTVTYAIYEVRSGDTLYAIGKRFKVGTEELQSINRISDPRSLKVGQKIKIPYRGQEIEPPDGAADAGQGMLPSQVRPDASSIRTVKLSAARKYVGNMAWPLRNPRITSSFGRRWFSFHEGLDFGGSVGTPVYSAHDGVVVYSDDRIRGYGNMVIVRGDGLLTVYAHNNRNRVDRGDKVKKGEHIADLGASGRVTGPHLHFETRIRNSDNKFVAVDPMAFYRGG